LKRPKRIATGKTVRARAPDTRDELTAQEAQIVPLDSGLPSDTAAA
jgi:hypothetical protein